MLIGSPPFWSEDQVAIVNKIKKWQNHFWIPSEANLSRDATDIIKKFITHAQSRLGANGVEEIMAHPFFYGIDWKNLRN